MRYREIQEKLREMGIVISKKGGTLRINYFSGMEDTARYVTSLQEALEEAHKDWSMTICR